MISLQPLTRNDIESMHCLHLVLGMSIGSVHLRRSLIIKNVKECKGRVWGSDDFCTCETSRFSRFLRFSSQHRLLSLGSKSNKACCWKHLLDCLEVIKLALQLHCHEVEEDGLLLGNKLPVPLAHLFSGRLCGGIKKGGMKGTALDNDLDKVVRGAHNQVQFTWLRTTQKRLIDVQNAQSFNRHSIWALFLDQR